MGIVILRIVFILFGLMFLFVLFTNKYTNPYKLIMIFGKKGAGKSTTLTKLALQHIKKGWTVYSTELIPGTYYVRPDDIGFVDLPDVNFVPRSPNDFRGIRKLLFCISDFFFPHKPKTLLLIDEVGMIWDNRNYKSFKPEVRDFFKLQRHRHIKCILFSQTFDIDKKLRDLTDEMFLIKNVFRVFSYGKRIRKFITITNGNSSEDFGTLAEGLEFESFLLFFAGSRTLTFIPKYSKYFNSYSAPKLNSIEYKCTPFNRDMVVPDSDSGGDENDKAC